MNKTSFAPPLPDAPSRRRRASRKAGIGFAFLGSFLITLIVVRAILGSLTPNVVIPPINVPTPNAFDVFVQAGKMTDKDGAAISDAVMPKPGKEWSHADKAVLLARNAPALVLVRRGLTTPYRDASGPRSFDTKFPQYGAFRTLARLMILEGDVRRESGDTAGAAQSYSDTVVFGHTLLHGAPLTGYLVGRACESIGRKPLWKMVDSMDAQTARQTAQRLETLCESDPVRSTFADTMTEEKYWEQASMMEFYQKRIPGFSLVGAVWSKRTTMNNYTSYMDAMIAACRQPYRVQPKLPPIPADTFSQILIPSYESARYKIEAYNTQNALMTVRLGVRAYEAEHNGAAPPNLQILVPRYLSRVPVDPFACPVAPLRYNPSGSKFVLYSVGPDGKDNNGVPALNDSSGPIKESGKYYSTATSKGDIVAGVNLQ